MLALSLVVSCQRERGPPLEVLDVLILAPLPGSDAAVAYFSLLNHTDAPITVERISSPQFEHVEMHETTIDNGIARMAPLAQITIEPGLPTEFSSGGKHLMLMQARGAVSPGNSVTLEFHYAGGAVTMVSAAMQSR